ncbi:MAG TPA: hypothetical protein DEP38_08300, partial [Cyanobacteria bacterium UBA9226]|nr:hypothetical protein [Cyanobacteria bacterium UBA9226]
MYFYYSNKGGNMEKIDLIEILEKEVYPRLSASQIYTWEGHNFKESADRWRGNPPWGKSKSGSSFAVFPLSLRFIDSHNSETGDPVKYLYSLKIGQYEYPKGRDWIETIKELFAIAGVAFPDREWTPQQIKAAQQRQTRQEILKLVQGYCQEYLWTDNGYPERHHLINERGFTEESLKSLGIGLYPSSTDEMEEFLRTNQIDLRLANQIGVLASAWCGYIVFPWSSAYGDPLTLYGHQSKEWAIATDKPKKYALFNPKENKQAWLHTKESPYLFDRALKNHHRELVLVEGITDAAIAHQYEDTRVVACVAAMLSKDQCETLKRHRIERVIIALDPDEAGDKGIESCIKNLIQIGITPFVAPRLPDTLDPDEFIIKYGIDTWKEHIAGAHHGFTWKAKQIVKNSNLSTDYGKEKAIKLAKKFADSQNDKLAIANFFIPNLPFSLEPKTAQKIEEEENDSGELNKITRTENLIRSRWGNGKLRLNLMTKQLELDGKRFKLSRAVTTIAREFNIKIAADLAVEICVAIAEDNAYSPVRAYLENLKQQNITPYNLDTLAQDYLGCPDSLGYLKKTLIGAVARAMDPGCKMDTMLILQGKQGTYKSTFWSILAGKNGDQPFFTDNISDQDKDERMKLTRYWILEYSEFEAVYKRKDVETLKNFLTTKYDSIRLPYGREVEDFYRSSIFVGTTNRTDIL